MARAQRVTERGTLVKLRISRKNKCRGAAMDLLAREGARRVYVDGGKLVQAFLREGLIADMVITHIPVLLGAGRLLLGTTAFASGLVQSRYQITT